MQHSGDCPVVPMGRMSMGNAFIGRPRRRAPHGGAKLTTKEEERKKPSLKDLFGVTPLDTLGNVSTDDMPTPVKLFQKFIGTSDAEASDAQPEKPDYEEQKAQGVDQGNWHQAPISGQPMPIAQPHPQLDTRTNLEKYMHMKMQGSRCHVQHFPTSTPTPVYYAPDPYTGHSPGRAFSLPPSSPSPASTEGLHGYWGPQGVAPQHNSQYNFDNATAYQQAGGVGTSSRRELAVDNRDSSQQNYIPEGLHFENPPAWFQHKSYMPQVPQYSHMTAPVPGAAFHPGFSYATDFKYYYNYYCADQYAGEIDGGDATAQEEAVAREQQHAEEIVSRQVTRGEASTSMLKPIITSKKRLESGRAVVM